MAPLRTGLGILVGSAALIATGLTLPTPASAAAAVGACYDYPIRTIGTVSTAAPAMGCESPHTAQTYRVGTLAPSFGLPSKSSQAARLAAGLPCTVASMNSYLGMADRTLPSRFRPVALLPTDEQWNAGERWVRCDAVLQSGLQLQKTAGTGPEFVAATAQSALNFCTPSTPSARNTAAVQCTKPKSNWIKVLDKELGGPSSRFPGTSSVLRRSAVICQNVAKRYDGKVPYPGWWRINPTQHGWNLGKRSVQCFVPYEQFLKELAQHTSAPAPVPDPVPTPVPSA